MKSAIVLLFIAVIKDVNSDEYQALPWNRLLGRFNRILDRTDHNGGQLSQRDVDELAVLKRDMLDDCAAGKLKEYTGPQKYDFRKTYVVPATTYHLIISKEVDEDDYYWVLPVVNCNNPAEERKKYTITVDVDVSEDEDDVSESGSSNTDDEDEAEKERLRLASDDEVSRYIKRVRSNLNDEASKSGVTMAGVEKPPKMRRKGKTSHV